MKKFTLVFLLLISSVLPQIFAQFNWVKKWDHRYGGTDGDYVIAFEKTTHGGYILAGKTASDSSGNKSTHIFGTGAFDYWIVKLDSVGQMQWEKDFHGSDNDVFWAISQTSDGGYIIGGTSNSPAGGDKSQMQRGGDDYWVIKLDASGNKIWDKTFGGSGDEDLHCIIQTSDGGYLIGGDSRSPAGGDKTQALFGISDYWVVKTDSLGNKLWDKTYGGTDYERYRNSVQTPDHGFIHAGQSSSGISGNKTDASQGGVDYWLVKTDSSGNIQWDSAYGGNGDDNMQVLMKTWDGGYICGGWSTTGISGDKTQASNGQYDLWILKLNSSGVKEWDKDFGGTGIEDEFSDIYQTTDRGYLLGATSYSNAGADKTDNNLGVEQPWVIRIDSAGNKLWDKTIFTTGHDELGLIRETTDRDCYVVVTGDNGIAGGDKSEDAWGNLSSDYWIVKYCAGEATGLESVTLNDDAVMVYPDPFKDEIKIRMLEDFNSAVVSLYDLPGKLIYQQKFTTEISINSSQVKDGIYFLEINAGGKILRKKIVK
jgi:hypothetical protein